MNLVGEQIQIEEITKSCRSLDVRELMQLLMADINMFFSWGVQRTKVVDNTANPRMLRLTVNGHHHKGHVYIFVNGMDLYDVYLTSRQGKIKVIQTDLYFDDLAEWIDEKIEKIPAYVR
jgi:hypothetical protein